MQLVLTTFVFINKMEILAEALKDGVAPAIVVAIYLTITKIIDSKKESEQAKLSSKLIDSITTISSFIENLTENIVNTDRDKCKKAIENSMFASAARLINFVSTTIIHNNISSNKANIKANIKNIVNAEYYNVYCTLSLYTIDNTNVSDYLKSSWLNDVEKDIVDIIFNTDLNKEDKILAFSNKINIRFQNYITYVNNKVIK